jgi:predicted dehydrogenase
MADRASGNTLLTSSGGHAIDALCFCLGGFKELSSVVATQRQRVKIVETGEMIQMTSPDQRVKRRGQRWITLLPPGGA